MGKVLHRRRCRLGLVVLDECAGERRKTGEGWGRGKGSRHKVPRTGPGWAGRALGGQLGRGKKGARDRRARERLIARMRQGTDEGAVG